MGVVYKGNPPYFSRSIGFRLKKNFYKLLGVDRKADPEKIKGAYRKAAKRYHPDISPRSEEKFKEIQEAYETLSDPEKRAIYDREYSKKRILDIQPPPPRYSTPIFSTFNLFNDMDELFARFDHFWNIETDAFLSEGKEVQNDFYVEILLSPEEAMNGCELLLKVPIWLICKRCKGKGSVRDLICGLCRGRGEQRVERKIKDGREIKIPLKDLDVTGANNINVTLRIYR
jgi:DnaJ-class molecular chaperone